MNQPLYTDNLTQTDKLAINVTQGKNLMNRSNVMTLQHYLSAVSWLRQNIALLFIAITMVTPLKASEQNLQLAEAALASQQYTEAKIAFIPLLEQAEFKTQAQFGLARIALYTDELDTAEKHIERVLNASKNNPEHFFIAGRIAGKQAQLANVFSKLGYARDAKRYFTRALAIDNKHQSSLIGLIRFHQQAPVLAGGDKDAISELVSQLRDVDSRASFAFEAPALLEESKADQVIALYRAALKAPSTIDTGRFKFDFAMLMSSSGFYPPALNALLSIELPGNGKAADYAVMRLYQIGKLAAESKTLRRYA